MAGFLFETTAYFNERKFVFTVHHQKIKAVRIYSYYHRKGVYAIKKSTYQILNTYTPDDYKEKQLKLYILRFYDIVENEVKKYHLIYDYEIEHIYVRLPDSIPI